MTLFCALSNDIDNVKADLESISIQYEGYRQGSINMQEGTVWVGATKAVITPNTIDADLVMNLHVPNGYMAYLFSYGSDGAYLGRTTLGATGVDLSGMELKAYRQNTSVIRISVYKSNSDDDFTVEEFLATGAYLRLKVQSSELAHNIDALEANANEIRTTLDFCLKSLNNLQTTCIKKTTGEIETTISALICSGKYRCHEGDVITYTLSSDQAIFATYDERNNPVEIVNGTGYSNYISGSHTFTAQEKTFAVSGSLARYNAGRYYNITYTTTNKRYEDLLVNVANNSNAISNIEDDVDELKKKAERTYLAETLNYNDFYEADGLIRRCYNPYKDGGSRLLVGQMHCHDRQRNTSTQEVEFINTPDRATTLVSHKSAGYHWMTVTNYSHLLETYPTLTTDIPEDFTWLCDSMEVPVKGGTDADGNYEKIKHICTFNTHNYETETEDGWEPFMTLQDYADIVKPTGAMVALAHPYWTSTYVKPETLEKVEGRVRFCEVWNGLTEYHRETGDKGDDYVTYPSGKSSDYAWEKLLDKGLIVWGTAVSDTHSGQNNSVIKRGCVKVFANNNNRFDILKSLSKGNFYASSNVDVSLTSLAFSNGTLSINTGSASAMTSFLGESGEILATASGETASYTLNGNEKYVRAIIQYPTGSNDYQGNAIYEKIWTQPIINLFNEDYDYYFEK